MAAPKILVAGAVSERKSKVQGVTGSDAAWSLLSLVGAAFVIIGGVDLVLAWFPSALGSPEWEFGTIGASLNGFPLPALGIMLILGGGIARGSRWQVRSAAAVSAILVLLLLGFAFLYLTVIPVALGDVTNAAVRAGLMKSVVKALVLLALYPVLFGWAAYRGLRHQF